MTFWMRRAPLRFFLLVMVRRCSPCLEDNWKAEGAGAILPGHSEDLRNC
jgi:hypothetical protein